MRKFLLAAVSAAPLALVAGGARATTTISNGSTTPIATNTANAGAPDNVDVASGGSIASPTTTPGITLNSNNTVTIEGSVTSNNVVGATGVLLTGGVTGGFTNSGAITVTESYAATDTVNNDGVVEAPFAQGSGRYGVRLTGAAPFVGSIILGGSGVTVKGQNSFGVSLEAPVQGDLFVPGVVSLTGDNGVALQELGGVTGAVSLSAAITGNGQNTPGVILGGDVGGSATISSTITTTGYSVTTRNTNDTSLTNIQKTPTDVEQGGPALTIAGSVAGGVLFTAPPPSTVSGSTADLNNDGIADGVETASSVTSYGAAPAIIVGGAGKSISIGAFGSGTADYGLLLLGTVAGAGTYDGVTSNALTIGALGGQVNIAGGALVAGSLSSTAYEADSTAVHILSGASLPLINVTGVLTSIIDHSNLVTTPTVATSTAILVDAGATLSALSVTGTLSATGTGDALSTAAVIDRSGTLSSIVNEGTITSASAPVTVGDVVTGSHIALDLSKNTTGVTLVQQINPNPNTVYGSTSGTNATATTTVTAVTPEIVGDVLLGSGPNTVQILAGGVTGALSLGSAPSSFTITNGAIYEGALSYSGTQLALNVGNAQLIDTNPATLKLSSLNVATGGFLTLAVDPVNAAAASLQVSGAATIEAGGKIGITLLSPVVGTQTYALITSPMLSTPGLDTSLLSTSSYLYNASFSTDPAGDALVLTLQQRTTAQLGLDRSEAAALPAVLAGVVANPSVERALLAPSDKPSFLKIYDQLLPDHGGGVFLAGQEASMAISRNTTDHIDMADPGAAQSWAKEFTLGGIQDKQTGDSSHIGGFGFVGGASTSEGPLGALGVTAAFVDATITDPELSSATSSSFSELEAGLYWTAEAGPLRLSARAGGGYLFGVTRRLFQASPTPDNPAVMFDTKASWNGWTASGELFASYQLDLGRFFVRPQAHVDYFTLSQDAYSDESGSPGFNLSVNSRSGQETSASGSVVFGTRFGALGGVVFRPNVEVGVREVFSGEAGDTTAAFQGGGTPFTLTANPLTGLGETARVGLKVDGELYEISFDAQGEAFAHYYEGDAGVTIRFHF